MTEQLIPVNQLVDALTPKPKPVEMRLQELVDSGLITWNGKRFQPDINRARPRLPANAPKTAAEVVLEDRS